jgi:hypothetical protein
MNHMLLASFTDERDWWLIQQPADCEQVIGTKQEQFLAVSITAGKTNAKGCMAARV